MDKDTRNAIERATQRARRLLEEDFAAQLEGTFDVLRDGSIAPKAGSHLAPRQVFQREKIVAAIEHKRDAGMSSAEAVVDYLRDAAFTTLNRFVALKMLEARELMQECITKGEQSTGYREFCGMAPGIALLPDSAGYRIYIESLFDELSTEVKVLFDRRDTASALWPKRQTFNGLLRLLNAAELATVWNEDETIGWVYQFFNTGDERKKMREESQAPRNSRELAVRNQFFTPRYVVQFLADNTLGRLWLEMHGEKTRLVKCCEYLVRPADEPVRPRPKKDPRDLRVLDPACGSGHFLLYCFYLLLIIYEEAWEDQGCSVRSQVSGRTLHEDYPDLAALRKAVPALIIEHNLYGVDIDPRCAQIAALALWLRAQRAYKDFGVAASARPRIRRTHIVVAEPMPGDAALVEEFAARLDPPLLRDLFRKMVSEMRLAGDLGTLIPVEKGIATELRRAREQFVKQRQMPGFLPGFEPVRTQGELDISGIDDDRFFHKAEASIVEALRRFAETAAGGANVRRRLFAGDTAQGVALIDLLRTRFDVVLMNPPFGEMPERAKTLLSARRAPKPLDAYIQFLHRGTALLATPGYVGALVSKTFLSHAEFETARRWLLGAAGGLRVVADLGVGVLDAAVEAAAVVLSPSEEGVIHFFDVVDSMSKAEALGAAVADLGGMRTFIHEREKFLRRQGAPLAYRLSEGVMSAMAAATNLDDVVDGTWGLFTADDERFVRAWWEVEPEGLGRTWLPFAKGGKPRAFFSEPLLVVHWRRHGTEILCRKGDKGQVLARAPNRERYGQPGLTYSSISSSGLRVRPLFEGTVFSIKGPALFPTVPRAQWMSMLEMLNTGEASYMLSTLSVNRSAELNYALRISIPTDWGQYFSGDTGLQLFARQKGYATGSETSRFFTGYPLERDTGGPSGRVSVPTLLERLNESGRKAYTEFGLDYDAVARFSPTAQHLASAPVADVHAVLSYLVGAAFGRWKRAPRRDHESIEIVSDVFAPTPQIPVAATSQLLRLSGSPGYLVDDRGHAADIAAVVVSCATDLSCDDPRIGDHQTIASTIRSAFFAEHIRRYTESGRKAPIYWQLGTPASSYSVWLYAHSLTRDSFFQLQNEVVGPKLTHEERQLASLMQNAGGSPTAQERKEIAVQETVVEELRAMLDEVKRVAPLWNPNLDDGVVLTMAPLWRLVPQYKPWQKELKAKWDELSAGKYDWAHLAMHLWPERVVPKCATDRSLAIAHGLESEFWVKGSDGKWKPRTPPLRSVEELVRERSSPAVKAALKSLTESPVARLGGSGRRPRSSAANRFNDQI